ncbi:MAG: hypothetical protein R3E66_16110 [bacterium]
MAVSAVWVPVFELAVGGGTDLDNFPRRSEAFHRQWVIHVELDMIGCDVSPPN